MRLLTFRGFISGYLDDFLFEYSKIQYPWLVRTVIWKLHYYTGEVFGWSCQFIGHEPTPDGCGMPHHDLCLWCYKPTPDLSEEKFCLMHALELDES